MINYLLPSNPSLAPKKKFRGHRRYFKKLNQKVASMTIGSDESDWYDQWHTHIDWDGYGNLRWKFRELHLKALATAFKQCAEQLKNFRKQFQLFMCLNSGNSQGDGIFIHTENPNGSEFPCIFENTTWDENEVSDFFHGLLPNYQLRVGVQRWLGQQVYLVYAKGVGLPIESPNNGVVSDSAKDAAPHTP